MAAAHALGGRGRLISPQGQPSLWSEFQDCQGYVKKPSLKKPLKKKKNRTMGDQKLRERQMEKRLNIYTTIGRYNKIRLIQEH